MSVELSPATTLGFPRPLTQMVKRTLTIHNPHSTPIAFKVKTTAPKQYCVRPNSGRVEAGESVEISVLLQPLPQDPPPHAKCKDKFLVQSAYISPDEEMKTLSEMWSETEKTNKAAIHEQKVKCAFLPPEDGTSGANGIPEEPEDGHHAGEQSRLMDESRHDLAFNSPRNALSRWSTVEERAIDETLFRNGGWTYWEVDPKAAAKPPVTTAQIYTAAQSSPVHHSANGTKNISAPVPSHAQPPAAAATGSKSVEPPLPPLTTNAIAQTKGPSPTDAALEKSADTGSSVSDKLNLALAEIDRLRAQLAESQGPLVTGLRKRGAGAQAGAETAVDTAIEKGKEVVAAAQGVPVEVVGGLVLVVFVLTYLFF